MTELHTTLFSQHYPGPFLPTTAHIRLLILQPGSDSTPISCELVATELSSAPAYEALSYTWGDPSAHQNIYITTQGSNERKEFSISSNCFSALTRLRHKSEQRILWVDAICIDQSNLLERNTQVTLMSNIYSQASQVDIHLGEATTNSDLAIDFITECHSPAFETTSLSYPKSDELVQALIQFFQRPWFTRVWVIQEAMLSKSGVVYCGNKTLTWSAIRHFNQWNTNTKWLDQVPFVVSMSKKSQITDTVERVMLNALLRSRHCGATNPRDKVYALLPLLHSFENTLAITPRYGDSPVTVFTDCATALVAECGFDVLFAVQGGSTLDNLPSWVPDWSIAPKRRILGSFGRIAIYWDPEKHGEASQSSINPSGNTEIGAAPMLRISAHSCGDISNLGSVYLADKCPFPLDEWLAMLDNETVKSIDRTGVTPLNDREVTGPLRYQFHEVIGAAGFAYYEAIRSFVLSEMPSTDSTGSEGGTGSESDQYEGPWMASVRKVAEASKDGILQYKDIPFQQAGRDNYPSYSAYIRFVLQTCHSRRFFITDSGYMGIAPAEAELGDQIFIFAGASVPFVFRSVPGRGHEKNGKRVRLVGECYMERIAWSNIKEGKTKFQDIYVE